MVTHEIKSIGAFQASLVFGLVNFVFGVVTAIAMSLAPMTSMMGGHSGMLLWLPFGYTIGAFVGSAIFCVAYNMVARRWAESRLSWVPSKVATFARCRICARKRLIEVDWRSGARRWRSIRYAV